MALLNFLFYQKNQSELRIHALVRDVAPSWISHLMKEAHGLANRAAELLGRDRWHLDLTAIYRLIPLRSGQREEYKKLLHIYQSLLARRPISYSSLIGEFIDLAAIYLTGNFTGTSVPQPEKGLRGAEYGPPPLAGQPFLDFPAESKAAERR